MPVTILFDLDDTLLSTNMNHFLPGYFGLLGKALNHLGSPEKITQQIQFAVRKMNANTDPQKTLKEVFDIHFYKPLGTTEEACRYILNSFYKDDFPKLQPITQTKQVASELVAWCRSKSMTMAIATNPLFPRTATQQRIQWAGLTTDTFAFFSTYEDFHFTKPNLAYYAEVLAQLGWPEENVVMIGDSLELDLLPMQQMGFETFLVDPEEQDSHQPAGTLSDVKPWLSNLSQSKNTLNNHHEINFAILQSTPAVIDSWLRLTKSNQFPELSIETESQFVQSIQAMIDYDKTIIEILVKAFEEYLIGFPPNIVNSCHDPGQQDIDHAIPNLLSSFINIRKNNLALLKKLAENQAHGDSSKSDFMAFQNPDAIITSTAQHDRKSIRACVNMLNIYKIY